MKAQLQFNPRFSSQDAHALGSIEFKVNEHIRALELSPTLLPSLEAEIGAAEQALEKARAAGLEYEAASVASQRADLVLKAALAEYSSSLATDDADAERIVRAVERAKYLAAAHARRTAAAFVAVESGYTRAMKEINERNAAVRYAERLAGAVIDRDPGRIELETRPGVIAWLRLVFPVEGRTAYARSAANRAGNRSYPEPPPIEDFDDACRSFFAQIESLRDQAARQAAELAAVST
ncbi:MAG: hypothetical protein EOO73_34765 [Myxococcales bacterium]|nr:MAG: hypothetical protein EOO73_34765 [Myxococcales bacterium]